MVLECMMLAHKGKFDVHPVIPILYETLIFFTKNIKMKCLVRNLFHVFLSSYDVQKSFKGLLE